MANRVVRSNRTAFHRGPRRDTFWLSAFLDGFQITAANADILLSGFTSAQLAAVNAADATLVRTRGALIGLSDQATAAEGGVIGFGIMFQNERARVAGSASCPRPLSDPDGGWFVHEILPWMSRSTTDVGQENAGFERIIDSKAMRKVKGNDSMIFRIENGSSSFGMRLTFGLHFLFKVG